MDEVWGHLCSFIYAGGQRPSRIYIQGIDRCPYCGEVSPRRQAEVDASSVDLLKKTQQFVNIDRAKATGDSRQ